MAFHRSASAAAMGPPSDAILLITLITLPKVMRRSTLTISVEPPVPPQPHSRPPGNRPEPMPNFNGAPITRSIPSICTSKIRSIDKVRHPEFGRLGGATSGWSGERAVRRRGKEGGGRGQAGWNRWRKGAKRHVTQLRDAARMHAERTARDCGVAGA